MKKDIKVKHPSAKEEKAIMKRNISKIIPMVINAAVVVIVAMGLLLAVRWSRSKQEEEKETIELTGSGILSEMEEKRKESPVPVKRESSVHDGTRFDAEIMSCRTIETRYGTYDVSDIYGYEYHDHSDSSDTVTLYLDKKIIETEATDICFIY